MSQDSRPFADNNAIFLPQYLGLEFEHVDDGAVIARLPIKQHHMAPNGYLHAATVVALADSACGYGCTASLPEGASSFTTIELKSNFLGTATSGQLRCEASLVHRGRTTQIWDAEVYHEESGRRIALFRCTQLIIYPRAGSGAQA